MDLDFSLSLSPLFFFFFSVILLYFRLGSICVDVACQQRRTRRIVTSECWRVMERREARICLIFENLQLPQKIGQDWGPEWFVMTGRRRRAEKERFTDDEWVICRAPLRIIFGHTGVEKKKKRKGGRILPESLLLLWCPAAYKLKFVVVIFMAWCILLK